MNPGLHSQWMASNRQLLIIEISVLQKCWSELSEYSPCCTDVVGVVQVSADPSRRVVTNPETSTAYGALL
jgi:hypothetical protein